MPKEVVYADLLPYGEEQSAVSIIEITWSRDASHVQIATRCVHAADHSPFVWPEFEELLRGKMGEDDAQSILNMMSGLWATLDRTAINAIIRHLRRARDQAFGKDE